MAVTVNRAKLAEYVKNNIDALLENADIDLDVYDSVVSPQQMEFHPTVRVRIEGIPVDAVSEEGKL